jgi:AcrR family transcriptional regulator
MSQENRRQSVQSFKRQHILTAAKTLFATRGLTGVTMRAIAKEAGYSLGAAYRYYPSKDDIYFDLLALSLNDLGKYIRSHTSAHGTGSDQIFSGFKNFFLYFKNRPEDQRLCLSLFATSPARALPEGLNKSLNSKLIIVLGFLANLIHHNTKLSANNAQTETLDATAFIAGVLFLYNSENLNLMRPNTEEMVDRYVERMLLRVLQ